MSNKLQIAVQSILAGSALSLLSTGAWAGAITIAGSYSLGAVGTEFQTASTPLNNDSWTNNPTLDNDAWGHLGNWYNFSVTAVSPQVDVLATVLSGDANVAFTVYASNGAFNGGKAAYGEISATGLGAPHAFNAVGQVGSFGTVWATDPSVAISSSAIAQGAPSLGGGNLLDTLAYANSGVAQTNSALNGYGQVINYGVNQVATDNTYFNGSVGGSVSATTAELIFNNLAVGNYTIFVGGANAAETLASNFQITVSAVPLPTTVYLFGSTLVGLLAARRRKQGQA